MTLKAPRLMHLAVECGGCRFFFNVSPESDDQSKINYERKVEMRSNIFFKVLTGLNYRNSELLSLSIIFLQRAFVFG